MEDRIGPVLRQARLERGLSLRGLAAASGISASQLSQIETGKSQPSVSALYTLVTHLDVSLDELLGLGPRRTEGAGSAGDAAPSTPHSGSSVVQHAADNPVLEMAGGVRWERLAIDPMADVDVLLVTYQPGAASSMDRTLMRHQGTEYAYLLSGELTLLLDFDRHSITAGDSLCFDSTRPHLYINQGTEAARGVWFVSGRHDPAHTREWMATQLGVTGTAPANHITSAVDVLDLLGATGPGKTIPGAQGGKTASGQHD